MSIRKNNFSNFLIYNQMYKQMDLTMHCSVATNAPEMLCFSHQKITVTKYMCSFHRSGFPLLELIQK